MNAIIVEDEPLVAKNLINLVSSIDAQIKIEVVLDSLKAAVEYVQSNPEPDLIFMDIQLSDGVSFDLLSKIKLTSPIIFTTAYDEYAIRAFKLNSIDYLLKPVDREELVTAINKFKTLREQSQLNLHDQINALTEHLRQSSTKVSYKQRFMVHSGKSYVIVESNQVSYFVKDAIIYLVNSENQKFVTDFTTIEEIEGLLDPAVYFRANRQTIIKIDSVGQFQTDNTGKLKVKLKAPLGMEVDVSREKAQEFKKWLG